MIQGVYRKEYFKDKNKLSIDLIVILILIGMLCFRCIVVLNSYRERGAYTYVQLLNYCMPIVEETVYDKGDYAENKVTIKYVLAEAIGLNKLNTLGIVTEEIPFFNFIDGTYVVSEDNVFKQSTSAIKPYELKEESIAKITPEQQAELDSQSGAYDSSLKKVLDTSVPEVLIYHTHTHESYGDGGNVDEGYNYNTDNSDFNVVGVGDVLTKELQENYGISVIHDKTIHDASYNDCYGRSRETLQSYLNQYGDFKLIIDLHRDSSENRNAVATEINGESLARIMFVTAGNSERYYENVAVVNDLISIANRLFPSILRSTSIFEYDAGQRAFNLSLSDNVIILEDGSIANTAQEAKLTGKYVARIIAEYINNSN